MAAIRTPQSIWEKTYAHLFSTPGEHFAFLLARWTFSDNQPVFMVHDAVLIPDHMVDVTRHGWELTTQAIIKAINSAVASDSALIEVHNHGGNKPRFSGLDRAGLMDFPNYVLDSLPGRPYAATVWGDSTIYGEYFLETGQSGRIDSICVSGDRFLQLVSRDDDEDDIALTFARQTPWFTEVGQRTIGRMRIAIAGAGGNGSLIAQNLVYLGGRDFVIIEDDDADETSMNRLATASAADVDTPKGILARRLIKSVAPIANVRVIRKKVQTLEALDALKGADILFGCFDNDAPRLILNELALAYRIPYFDLSTGIDAVGGNVSIAGGRVAIVLPDGPCLNCMGEIDSDEAAFFLDTPEGQARKIALGYVQGMDVKAPSVISLNAAIAATATTEFAMLVSGVRPVNWFTELDLLGVGRSLKSQWLTPVRVSKNPACVQCALALAGDKTNLERYALADDAYYLQSIDRETSEAVLPM